MMRRALRNMRESGALHILALAAVALLFLALCGGCKNAGTYAVVGELDAPVDISDGSDTINVRALFSLTGAKVWSARNSRVEMTYTNSYTNAYFGIVEKRGVQRFGVKVLPTTDEAEAEDGTSGTSETTGADAALSTENDK